MGMVCLVYASRFARGVGPNDVQDILTISRERNKAAGITGVLCYDPRFFLQVLEGPRDAVNELYCDIAGDKRHDHVMILSYQEVAARLFDEWSLAYVRMDDSTRPICRKYCLSGAFDPYAMTAEQALGFVTEMSAERQRYLDSLTSK